MFIIQSLQNLIDNMLYKNVFLTICLLFQAIFISAQLTLRIVQVPVNTPTDATLYAAGDFNGWEPEDSDFAFTKNDNGSFEISLNIEPGAIKFKVTRGGWDTVEGSEQGTFRPDRELVYNGGQQVEELIIAGWEDLSGGSTGGENSTAAANVSIINDFQMPQFSTTRDIWVYLPPGYATSGKNYPVLYMHDAQNLFDRSTSFSGEWEVDESLNALFENDNEEGIIVVGVENGGANRINELTSWPNSQYGGGEGARYADFIVNTLKPHIDNTYRTLPQREFTGVAGSSLGGLMSMYMAMEFQEVFSKAGIFSPSFWWSDAAYQHVRDAGKREDMRFYFVAGENESEGMIPDMQAMYNTLLNLGFEQDDLSFKADSDGQHSEWYWAREFPAAYEFLFANLPTSVTDLDDGQWVKIAPNPASERVYVEVEEEVENGSVKVYTMDGHLVKEMPLERNNSIDINTLDNGMYLILVMENCMPIANQKLVVEK